jgi:hypothetical protein
MLSLVSEPDPASTPSCLECERLSPPIPLERAKQDLRGVVGVYTVVDRLPDTGVDVVLDVGFADDDLTKRLSDPDLTYRWAGNAQGSLAVSYCAIPGMALEPWVERRRVQRSLRRAFRLPADES